MDTLQAGARDDDLMGEGGGADLSVLTYLSATGTLPNSRDVITSFQSRADCFDLSGLNANFPLAGNQAFRNLAGQLRNSAATGHMESDLNDDAPAYFAVELQKLATLAAADLGLLRVVVFNLVQIEHDPRQANR